MKSNKPQPGDALFAMLIFYIFVVVVSAIIVVIGTHLTH